ncbi:oxalurate catabolism protein HpxZ [Leptothermofonsia sp. ETS-13]|uniref:oxalurate catabolism protein HpxZ n=1 Tax=Leptothermofonsia sp. ETS-13 TaxID=3035696 RepID=UPI003BA36145
MTPINDPALVDELTTLYFKYEKALCENDIGVLDDLFWDSPHILRFGATENLYGDEIRTFCQNRPTQDLAREISNLKVVTFGVDTASITLEFCRTINGIFRSGRQSQMWQKLPEGWRIVSAHVSLLPESGKPHR